MGMQFKARHISSRQRTLNQDAQVGARKGRVGVVQDLQLAVGVEHEQCRLRERVVRLALAAPPMHILSFFLPFLTCPCVLAHSLSLPQLYTLASLSWPHGMRGICRVRERVVCLT